jgi:hypothetical protein
MRVGLRGSLEVEDGNITEPRSPPSSFFVKLSSPAPVSSGTELLFRSSARRSPLVRGGLFPSLTSPTPHTDSDSESDHGPSPLPENPFRLEGIKVGLGEEEVWLVELALEWGSGSGLVEVLDDGREGVGGWGCGGGWFGMFQCIIQPRTAGGRLSDMKEFPGTGGGGG